MAKKNITTQGTPIQGLLTQTLSNVFDVNNLASIKSKPSDDSLDRFNTLDYALVTKYVQNGLTVTSNNVNIHPRDTAGNIIMQENSAENPLLIIEPTTTKISTTSMLRVLDTRFEYYKFPVTRVDIAALPEIDLSDLVSDPPDPFYARYKPSADQQIFGGPSLIASGIELSNVVDGLPQATANAYTVNQIVKDSGKNLRVRARIQHSFIGESGERTINFEDLIDANNFGDPNNPADVAEAEAAALAQATQQLVEGFPGYMDFYIGRGGTSGLSREFAGPFGSGQSGLLQPGQTRFVDIDFIIENKDFQVGTTFGINAKTGQIDGHFIKVDETFLSITDASKNVDDFNRPV
jgi:hypothetical protein